MKPKTVGRISGEVTVETPCLVSGLRADSVIMTLSGEMAVSDLSPGDRVITRDSGMAHVRSAISRKVLCRAVRILAGSLGHTRPDCDVTLPAGQPVLVRDWRARAIFGARQALVPAHRLIDGEYIIDQGEVELTLYHLVFDAPHVLYVDGLELSSDASAGVSGETGSAAA
mgnify:CR=1 FL=1